jgi:hypothetical protein
MRIRQVWLLVVGMTATCGLLLGAGNAVASTQTVAVGGAVATPHTYSLADLAALPQTTVQTTRQTIFGPATYSDTGVSLRSLVTLAAPTLPTGPKNATLRVTIGVQGLGEPVTTTLGELDPSFGDEPAVLVLRRDGSPIAHGPQLVFPTDATDSRTVLSVSKITVGVQNPVPAVPAHAGDLSVTTPTRTTVFSAGLLALLPSSTRTVTFLAGSTPQTHTETGPDLLTVLATAGARIDKGTFVAGVGSDGYAATVTPAEELYGGRGLMISLKEDGGALAQPRLVVIGDVKGGRSVSMLTKLVVGEG